MTDTSESTRVWKVDRCSARDSFEMSTRHVAQWCDGDGVDVDGTRVGRWLVFMSACSAVLPDVIAGGGLRTAPRVGYDPVSDQPFFIFKCSQKGTTYFVSRDGIRGIEES